MWVSSLLHLSILNCKLYSFTGSVHFLTVSWSLDTSECLRKDRCLYWYSSMSGSSQIFYKSIHRPPGTRTPALYDLQGDIWLYSTDWKEGLHSQWKRQLWIKQTYISLRFKSYSQKCHACFSLFPSSGLFLLFSLSFLSPSLPRVSFTTGSQVWVWLKFLFHLC